MPLDGVEPVDSDEDLDPPPLPQSVSNTINLSPNERILALEIQIAQLRQDTSVIRRSGHRVENEMQKFVALEHQCVTNLANINASLSGLVSTVNSLSSAKVYTDGVVATIIKAASFILGLGLLAGALSGKIHINF